MSSVEIYATKTIVLGAKGLRGKSFLSCVDADHKRNHHYVSANLTQANCGELFGIIIYISGEHIVHNEYDVASQGGEDGRYSYFQEDY